MLSQASDFSNPDGTKFKFLHFDAFTNSLPPSGVQIMKSSLLNIFR